MQLQGLFAPHHDQLTAARTEIEASGGIGKVGPGAVRLNHPEVARVPRPPNSYALAGSPGDDLEGWIPTAPEDLVVYTRDPPTRTLGRITIGVGVLSGRGSIQTRGTFRVTFRFMMSTS